MLDFIERIGSVAGTFTIPLIFLVGIIFILRLVSKNGGIGYVFNWLNRRLRSAHIPMGIILVAISTIHCVCSSLVIWGAICFVTLIFLTLSYVMRQRITNWMMWHRLLSVVFYITFIIHLFEVSGMR